MKKKVIGHRLNPLAKSKGKGIICGRPDPVLIIFPDSFPARGEEFFYRCV
jgi:hypothetical protein